jgi:hypothetical protein
MEIKIVTCAKTQNKRTCNYCLFAVGTDQIMKKDETEKHGVANNENEDYNEFEV